MALDYRRHPNGLRQPVHSRLLTGLLVSAALLQARALEAEQIPVRFKEGTVHGFLVLRTQKARRSLPGTLFAEIGLYLN